MKIIEELIEIWPNEVCDRTLIILLRQEHLQIAEKGIQTQIKKIQTRKKEITKILEKKDRQA